MHNSDAPSLVWTKNAAHKVWALIQEEQDLSLNLRVYVTGGGCSGFQYGFTFDPQIEADDVVFEQSVPDGINAHTVRLLVDSKSYLYLNQATIDYQEDVQGERFIIRNPNAQSTCGCGSSFCPKEEPCADKTE